MNPVRQTRMIKLMLIVLVLSTAIGLVLVALSNNINLFFTPSQIVAGDVVEGQYIRVGGLVVTGSVQRDPSSLQVSFALTDTAQQIIVRYDGILPDLFREGQGIVAEGQLHDDQLMAHTVLAKHDESYMPPEVEEAVKQAYLAKRQAK